MGHVVYVNYEVVTNPKVGDELYYVSPMTGYYFVLKIRESNVASDQFVAECTETDSKGYDKQNFRYNGQTFHLSEVGEKKTYTKQEIVRKMKLIKMSFNYNSIWKIVND